MNNSTNIAVEVLRCETQVYFYFSIEASSFISKNSLKNKGKKGATHVCRKSVQYELQKQIWNFTCFSKSSSITDYFIDFKCVWNELVNYDPYPEYSCGAMKILDEKNDYEYVMRFLMGLNENYSTIRSKVLMSNPIPDIN